MKLRQAALKAARERWADYILVRLWVPEGAAGSEPAGETEQNLQGRRNGGTRKRRGGVTLSEGDLHKVISAVARLNGVDMKPLICETAYYNITWYALRTVFLH